MRRLATVFVVFAAMAIASAAEGASKHTRSYWVSTQLTGLGTSLFVDRSAVTGEMAGDINGPYAVKFQAISFVPKMVLLSGRGAIDCCNLGQLSTTDQVVLVPICEPCIYTWVGTHYIVDSECCGRVNGILHSTGIVMFDRRGTAHVDLQFTGFVVERIRPLLQTAPGFSVD